MPNCSNMIFKPQESIVQDDVTSHVTRSNFFVSLVSYLPQRPRVPKLLQNASRLTSGVELRAYELMSVNF